MKTFVESLLEKASIEDGKAAKEKLQTAAADVVTKTAAASVPVVDKKNEPAVAKPSAFVTKLQKQCEGQIAQNLWGRVFDNFPNKFCFDQEKFQKYYDRYHILGVATSAAEVTLETGLIDLEEKSYREVDKPAIQKMKADVKQWMDELITDICHLFLNTQGEIRKDILSLLALNKHELVLNQKKLIIINSCLEEIYSSVMDKWLNCGLRRRVDLRLMSSRPSDDIIININNDLYLYQENNKICYATKRSKGIIRGEITKEDNYSDFENVLAILKKSDPSKEKLNEKAKESLLEITSKRGHTFSGKSFTVKDDLKLSAANLTISYLIQLYVKDESNMKKIIANYINLMRENPEAKRARALVLVSEDPVKLEQNIEAEFKALDANLKDNKIRNWINIAYYCIADGDYVVPRAFLNVCKKLKFHNHILNKFDGEYTTKYISSCNCLNYLDERRIELIVKEVPKISATVMYTPKTAAAPATGAHNPDLGAPVPKR